MRRNVFDDWWYNPNSREDYNHDMDSLDALSEDTQLEQDGVYYYNNYGPSGNGEDSVNDGRYVVVA